VEYLVSQYDQKLKFVLAAHRFHIPYSNKRMKDFFFGKKYLFCNDASKHTEQGLALEADKQLKNELLYSPSFRL